jgi:purine-nucleoside phosphorylase
MNSGFDSLLYKTRVEKITKYIKSNLGNDFKPRVALTLGSGGFSSFVQKLEVVKRIPYTSLPQFIETGVEGHEGQMIFAYINKTPVVILSGRKHFYELGGIPNLVTALKEVVLPVYVMAMLGVSLYVATNAAGGLNSQYNAGDLMIIRSHLDLFFPNVLMGPQIDINQPQRFQSQSEIYNNRYRKRLLSIAKAGGIERYVHSGIYAALTGPTYESSADSQALRTLGADAVGMSTVPEVITAANLGLETVGISLITNVISADGTNKTSHEEVQQALNSREVKEWVYSLLSGFIGTFV